MRMNVRLKPLPSLAQFWRPIGTEQAWKNADAFKNIFLGVNGQSEGNPLFTVPMADLGRSFSLTAPIGKVQVTDEPETNTVTGSYKVEFKLRPTSSSH